MTHTAIILEYLRECGHFFIAASAKGAPHIHMLTDICLYDSHLYIDAAGHHALADELSENPAIEIGALHPDKSHITLSARVMRIDDAGAKEAMREAVENDLNGHAGENMMLFRLEEGKAVIWDGFDRKKELALGLSEEK